MNGFRFGSDEETKKGVWLRQVFPREEILNCFYTSEAGDSYPVAAIS